jgi:alpha-beta hydrolase superfamily lysophospholipase
MLENRFENFEMPEGATTLVVLIHGLRGAPSRMAGLARAARTAVPDAATYTPRMAYADLFSLAQPEVLSSDLLNAIDKLVCEHGFQRVILVGHSIGSLIARKLVVLAHGESANAPFETGLERWRDPLPWANRMDRLVLSAGMLRGWHANAARATRDAISWSIGALLGDLLVNGRWTVLQTRAGAPFVVQTRLQWLALMRRPAPPAITTVQLLGTVDSVVSPEDTLDFLQEIAENRFFMLELPATSHADAIEVEGSTVAEERRARFVTALNSSPSDADFRDFEVPARFVTNGPPPTTDVSVTDVVFVIHGIRDRGFWTQKIAHKVMAEAERNGRIARSMTLSYGYLAMGPFLLPWVRREKVRWLMDRYANSRALYPHADFHYVGHSNGTYLAARALTDYPAASFKRVVFAGSVVRCDFDWQDRIAGARRQVDAVLNYVASADWVVAIFPNGLSRIRAFDLGGAGHHGFDHLKSPSATRTASGVRLSTVQPHTVAGTSHQIDYVSGGHSAGIRESQWDDIARFIVSGTPPRADDPDFVGNQLSWVRACAALPPAAFAIIVLIVSAVLGLLVAAGAWLGGHLTGTTFGGWVGGALAILADLAAVRVVLTRL